MAKGKNGSQDPQVLPASQKIAERGIHTSRDFRDLMSSLMSDVIAGKLTPGTTNAACNAGGKLLKMVELEHKYATSPERPPRTLSVAFETEDVAALPAGEEVVTLSEA